MKKRKVTTFSKIVKVLAKLVKQPVQEMFEDGLLNSLETTPISSYRCKYTTHFVGRKWYAPLYRPVLGRFTVKAKQFVAVRQNAKTTDIEFIDKSGESVTYTIKAQEWREKQFYFQLIPPERFRGGLGSVVSRIIQLRRSDYEGRQEVSARTASNLVRNFSDE